MSKQKRSNPLALAVLVLLYERPMHPYDMAATLRERRKEESIKLRYGSLYTIIASLDKAGFIRPGKTSREGNRPERTTYSITPSGEIEMREWLREILSSPAKEFPQFEAGLSLLPALPPAEAAEVLMTRVEFLKKDIEQLKNGLRQAKAMGLAPLFTIESEYRLGGVETELHFVESLIERIRKDGCGFLKEWKQWHVEKAKKAKKKTMNTDTDDRKKKQFYFGTRIELKPGDLIEPGSPPDLNGEDKTKTYVYLTPDLDGAIWEAELAAGEGPGRVYIVEPTGQIENISGLTDQKSPGHPSMSWRSRRPLRVIGEVSEWLLYHGTRADLKPGDQIKPGYTPNFGNESRTAKYVYLTRTMDAAIWGAELAMGEGPGRIYVVEPTGPVEDDPNLTNKKFRGNPTKAFRSLKPLRVRAEVRDWQGHCPEALEAMKNGLKRLKQLGIEPIED
jgi:rifampin ADP-ribosylating transferase